MNEFMQNPSLPPVVGQLVAKIQSFPSVQRVILYGSRAKGTHRVYSDIDIAVEGVADHREWTQIHRLADPDDGLTASLLRVDLVQLESVDPEVRQSITREGQTLYERQ